MTDEDIRIEVGKALIERIALIELTLEKHGQPYWKYDTLQLFIDGVKELKGTPEARILNQLQMTAYSQFELASKEASTERHAQISKWVQDDLNKGAGALHKVVAGTTKEPPKLIIGHATPTCPLDMAKSKLQLWEGHWKSSYLDANFENAVQQLEKAAKLEIEQEILEPILNRDVWRACKRGPSNTMGADHCTSRSLTSSGYEATDELGGIIRHCETTLAWPAQESCAIL